MRYIISEKQLANIIIKRSISDDLEYDSVDDASPENDDFVIGQEVDEQDGSSISTASSSSSSSDDFGSSPGAADYPPYPEVDKWESGLARGPGNPLATDDNVEDRVTRGHANPLR